MDPQQFAFNHCMSGMLLSFKLALKLTKNVCTPYEIEAETFKSVNAMSSGRPPMQPPQAHACMLKNYETHTVQWVHYSKSSKLYQSKNNTRVQLYCQIYLIITKIELKDSLTVHCHLIDCQLSLNFENVWIHRVYNGLHFGRKFVYVGHASCCSGDNTSIFIVKAVGNEPKTSINDQFFFVLCLDHASVYWNSTSPK